MEFNVEDYKQKHLKRLNGELHNMFTIEADEYEEVTDISKIEIDLIHEIEKLKELEKLYANFETSVDKSTSKIYQLYAENQADIAENLRVYQTIYAKIAEEKADELHTIRQLIKMFQNFDGTEEV